MSASCLYLGTVVHRRFKPRRHKLCYRVFWSLLDLDELPRLAKKLRLFSLNQFNLFSFYNMDHGDGSERPLRTQIEEHLSAAGLALDGGPIRLLCMPRILGYVFNPISIYYCYHHSGVLTALIYQVHNTFGQRHSYVIPVDPSRAELVEQYCPKAFYVSPFMDMDINYAFRVQPPGERVTLRIEGSDSKGPVIVASLAGARAAISDGALLAAFVNFPLLTLKVFTGIHWEALKLWIKGMRMRRRPPARAPVTIVPQASSGRRRHV